MPSCAHAFHVDACVCSVFMHVCYNVCIYTCIYIHAYLCLCMSSTFHLKSLLHVLQQKPQDSQVQPQVRPTDVCKEFQAQHNRITPSKNKWPLLWNAVAFGVSWPLAGEKNNRFQAPQCCEVFGCWCEERAWQQSQDEGGIRPYRWGSCLLAV